MVVLLPLPGILSGKADNQTEQLYAETMARKGDGIPQKAKLLIKSIGKPCMALLPIGCFPAWPVLLQTHHQERDVNMIKSTRGLSHR